MSEEKKYIYAIIGNPQETQAPNTFRLSEAMFGINDRAIVLATHRDIAAVVSNTHLINFDKLEKKELTQLIAVHDQVNAGLMKEHSVIPMRFGMVAESTEEIRNILAKTYIQLKAALKRTAGKAEFIVQVFWNEKNVLEKLVRENSEIQKLKKAAESSGKILGFSSKIKLGRLIFETLETTRKEYTQGILGDLVAHFPNFSAGKLLDKDMIMNYSFLIGTTEESTLEFRLSQLAEKYKDEFKFKYIGPMAPYSFAVINLSVGNFDLVDTARRTLRLGEFATFPEIRIAYHKLAAEHHPDKHEYKQNQAILDEATKTMKSVVAANEVLTVYCTHYLSALKPDSVRKSGFSNGAEKEQLCSFRKEDVENSIIIRGSV